MDKHIIPECYCDTNLIESLVPTKAGYNHHKGAGSVTKKMKQHLTDRFALGIIDKDKFEVDYLKEFKAEHEIGNLILHKHPTKHHYIIQLCPALEQFILVNAAAAGLLMEDYNLPPLLEDLTYRAKKITSKADPDFRKLFKDLLTHKAPDIVRLREWVNHLKDYNYKADLEYLKSV